MGFPSWNLSSENARSCQQRQTDVKLWLVLLSDGGTPASPAHLAGAQRDGALKQGPHHRLGARRGGQRALVSIEAGQILLGGD